MHITKYTPSRSNDIRPPNVLNMTDPQVFSAKSRAIAAELVKSHLPEIKQMCIANRGVTPKEIVRVFGVDSKARVAIVQLLHQHGLYSKLIRKGNRRDYVLLVEGQDCKPPPRPKKPKAKSHAQKRREECRKRIDEKFKTLKKLSQERWLNTKDVAELLALPVDNFWRHALCHSLRKAGFGYRVRGVFYKDYERVWVYGYKAKARKSPARAACLQETK